MADRPNQAATPQNRTQREAAGTAWTGHEASAFRADTPLPLIYLTTRDHERITALLARRASEIGDDLRRILSHELARAIVCVPEAIPRNVVTLNSRVLFRGHPARQLEERTLVDHEDMARSGESVSVFTPLGAALLGLAEGSQMPYAQADGTRALLRVDKIAYQPEAHGRHIVSPHRYWPSPRARGGRSVQVQHDSGSSHDRSVVPPLARQRTHLRPIDDGDDSDSGRP